MKFHESTKGRTIDDDSGQYDTLRNESLQLFSGNERIIDETIEKKKEL